MLKFKCADVGFNCGWTTSGNTQEEILQSCATHAQKDHGMKPSDLTEDLVGKIKSSIKQE